MYSNNFSRIDNVHLSALISRRDFRAFIAKQDQKKKIGVNISFPLFRRASIDPWIRGWAE